MSDYLYLLTILNKYKARDLSPHSLDILMLKSLLKEWASSCFLDILDSGSRAKGTAISIASDVDYLVSLTNKCDENNGGLKHIYNSLFNKLASKYTNVRKQNVSVRINMSGLEVDITPARKLSGNTNDHTLYVSKGDTWKQTNIQKHINDISKSNRLNEIRLMKIWREINHIDFPSIYLEYLLISIILLNKSSDITDLAKNFIHILKELAKDNANPLFARVVDPANTSNILSDLLSQTEKVKIINQAKVSIKETQWGKIIH
jgi:hypothetical protein